MSDAPLVFRLCDFGSVLVTRDQGEAIRQRLLALVETNQRVEVDLNGVEAYTPSFVDEVLGKCLERVGAERFKSQVRLLAQSQEVRKLVNLVLSNRSRVPAPGAGRS